MKRIGIGLVAVGLLAGAPGCAADSEDFDQLAESDVVGVTDIARLETVFKLTKDVQKNGKWARSDAELKAGGCYQEHLGPGAKEPQNWQFRRYTDGAAFFRKANTGAASGDKRPITCVDIDGRDADAVSLSGIVLDAALRYKMGAPQGIENGPGSYVAFDNGGVGVVDASNFCTRGLDGVSEKEAGSEPGYRAFYDELKKCTSAKKPNCEQVALNACIWWTTVDAQADTLDRPGWGNMRLQDLGSLDVSPQTASLAYKYSLMKGNQSNVFSLADDPVGLFESTAGNPEGPWSVVRYSRLDVHHVVSKGDEALYITPKSSDKKIAASAIVSCHRAIDATNHPTGKYTCKGL